VLLESGADPNGKVPTARTMQGPFEYRTLIAFFAGVDNAEMVRALLKFGADPLRRGSDGKTAIDVASGAAQSLLVKGKRS
jgi:hypothetical protein